MFIQMNCSIIKLLDLNTYKTNPVVLYVLEPWEYFVLNFPLIEHDKLVFMIVRFELKFIRGIK